MPFPHQHIIFSPTFSPLTPSQLNSIRPFAIWTSFLLCDLHFFEDLQLGCLFSTNASSPAQTQSWSLRDRAPDWTRRHLKFLCFSSGRTLSFSFFRPRKFSKGPTIGQLLRFVFWFFSSDTLKSIQQLQKSSKLRFNRATVKQGVTLLLYRNTQYILASLDCEEGLCTVS